MKNEDIEFIQNALGVSLPKVYVDTLLNYPFERFAGSADWELSDDPRDIVKLTKIYRHRTGSHTWNEDFICVGSDGATAPYFYNMKTGIVVQDERGHIYESFNTFEEFLASLIQDYEQTDWSEFEVEPQTRRAFWVAGLMAFAGLVFITILLIGFIFAICS